MESQTTKYKQQFEEIRNIILLHKSKSTGKA